MQIMFLIGFSLNVTWIKGGHIRLFFWTWQHTVHGWLCGYLEDVSSFSLASVAFCFSLCSAFCFWTALKTWEEENHRSNTNPELYKEHWDILVRAENLPYCRRPFWQANVGWPAYSIQEGTCTWFRALDTPSQRIHNGSFSETSTFSSCCRWSWASIFCWLYPNVIWQKRFWCCCTLIWLICCIIIHLLILCFKSMYCFCEVNDQTSFHNVVADEI